MDIRLIVQQALIGQVPSTLRFIYASAENQTLNFRAVFENEAPDDHLEAVDIALTEIISGCEPNTKLAQRFEKDSSTPWKIDGGLNLMYLRYGELSET